MAIIGIEDLRTTATRGLGGAQIGGWYPSDTAGQTNTSVARDTLFAVPFPMGVSSQIATQIVVAFNTAVTSMSVRLGIYDARSDGFPRTLLYDSGTIVMSASAHRMPVGVASLRLAPSTLYYTVAMISSASIFMGGPQDDQGTFGMTPDLEAGGHAYCVSASWAFAALPATFPASGVPAGEGPVMGVAFR